MKTGTWHIGWTILDPILEYIGVCSRFLSGMYFHISKPSELFQHAHLTSIIPECRDLCVPVLSSPGDLVEVLAPVTSTSNTIRQFTGSSPNLILIIQKERCFKLSCPTVLFDLLWPWPLSFAKVITFDFDNLWPFNLRCWAMRTSWL